MRFPFLLTYNLISYILKNKLKNNKIYSLVLMLEPLHSCNLSCSGCGRIIEYKDSMSEMLSLDKCFESVDQCNAPLISICGGEPLMYPQINDLVDGIIKRKKHIYLCTNGILLKKMINEFKVSPYLYFNVHIDGTEEIHDRITNHKGAYKKAIEAIYTAKKRGFIVCTNTTIYRDSKVDEIVKLFDKLRDLKVDGIIISPAYAFQSLDPSIFLNRQEIYSKFKELDKKSKNVKYYSSPIYRDFLKGEKRLNCTPWGNVTRNVKGWKAPCYLITDKHYNSWNDFIATVKWDNFGTNKDKRCINCMVHSGFESTVAIGTNINTGDIIKLIKWHLFG